MNVLYVDTGTGRRGGQVSLVQILRLSADYGIRAIAFFPGGSWLSREAEAFCERIYYSKCQSITIAAPRIRVADVISDIVKLHRIVRREKIQIIHSNTYLAALLAAPSSHLSRVPMIFNLRYDRTHRIYDTIIYRISKEVHAISHSVSGVVPSEFKHKIAIIHNFLDPCLLTAKGKRKVRMKFNLPLESFVVGCVGSLSADKGQDVLIEIFPELSTLLGCQVSLVFVGDSYRPEDRLFKSDLMHRSRSFGPGIFWMGWSNEADEIMQAFDLLVVPSRREAFGRVILEAWYLGIPVISSNTGGMAEIIEDGFNGVLFDLSRREQLAASIVKLRRDGNFRRELVKNARRTVTSKFGSDKYMRNLLSHYDRVIS